MAVLHSEDIFYSINMKIAEIEQIHSLKRSRCSKTVKMKNMIESVKNEAL